MFFFALHLACCAAVINLKTTVGGFFTILFCCYALFGIAFLSHTWWYDLYTIVADYQAYLVADGDGGVPLTNFYIEASFVGVDNLVACTSACSSVIGAASTTVAPYPFVTASTFSPLSSRKACMSAVSAADAVALGCGSASLELGSRAFAWSEGLNGTFGCASTAATTTSPAVCTVRFTPSEDYVSQPPYALSVHISLPGARAAGIAWRVRSMIFSQSDVGSRGSVTAPAGQLLGGTRPSNVLLALQPFTFDGNTAAVSSLPASASGFQSILVERLRGSTLGASDLVNASSIAAYNISAGVRMAASPLSLSAASVAVQFDISISTAGQRYSIGMSSTVTALITSISALIGGTMFALSRLGMRATETALARVLSEQKAIGTVAGAFGNRPWIFLCV